MVGSANQFFIVHSAHGPLARTCAGKGCTQSVALHERPVPVFPALREQASPHEGQSVFPAPRVERRERSVLL